MDKLFIKSEDLLSDAFKLAWKVFESGYKPNYIVLLGDRYEISAALRCSSAGRAVSAAEAVVRVFASSGVTSVAVANASPDSEPANPIVPKSPAMLKPMSSNAPVEPSCAV